MKRIRVIITAVDSLVITASSGNSVLTPSEDYISGTMMRGIFANEYIKCKQRGKDAHKDSSFRNLFFGSIRFLNAMPAYSDKPAFPIPFSIMKDKGGKKIMDMLKVEKPELGYKNVRGLATVEDDKLCSISVNKNILFHMSRGSDKERVKGRSSDGQIFNYESIDSGQQFIGEIIGDEANLKQLLEAIPDKDFFSHVGRSRFTQYGTVRVQVGTIEDVEPIKAPENNKVFIHVVSPIIPFVGIVSSARETLHEMLGNILGEIKIGKVFANVVAIDNFVNIWGMRRPRVHALGAGTVFELEKSTWTPEDIQKLEKTIYCGIGQRTQEGFGQLRVWASEINETGTDKVGFIEESKEEKISSDLVKNITANVVEKFIHEHLKQFAFDDAMEMKKNIEGKAHLFARLLQELGRKSKNNDDRQLLSKKIAASVSERDKSPFVKALSYDIKIKHCALKDLLEDTSKKMPYMDRWENLFSDNNINLGQLMEAIEMKLSDEEISNGKYFYTYWYWLFRYCLKAASMKEVH